ncbi:MAG TPA: hypothetical protein VFT81_06425 [Dermatophilaceae bacterium]|nr:hypothetical protein [Dermatophilaceae bacterium]
MCTGGPLEPGAAAGVNLELRFPPGTVGEELAMPVSASASTPERSLADNATQETFRYVMRPPADVALIALDLWPQQVRAGEEVTMSVYVGNQGGRPAEDVRLRIPLPDTVEATAENNEVSGTTTYLAEGTVSGRGWLDADGDGQRDPGEQHVTYEVGKIEFLREGTTSTWDTPRTTVNEMDGTYAQRLPVGRYVVHLYARDTANVALTTPDVGDDATDSNFA